MRTRFNYAQLPVSRWRNGGGVTREIISYPPGESRFAWRASIATIEADGPFSPFPGVDRVITLLHGAPVTLRGAHTAQRLLPHQPWAFPGEETIEAQVSGRCEDFNIMTRRDCWRAQVAVTPHGVRSQHGIAYVLTGEWQCDNDAPLQAQQGVWWLEEETALTPLSAGASLLWVTLSRVP